eukprot:1147798-Pelagomonas_calceolata.AAC.1
MASIPGSALRAGIFLAKAFMEPLTGHCCVLGTWKQIGWPIPGSSLCADTYVAEAPSGRLLCPSHMQGKH